MHGFGRGSRGEIGTVGLSWRRSLDMHKEGVSAVTPKDRAESLERSLLESAIRELEEAIGHEDILIVRADDAHQKLAQDVCQLEHEVHGWETERELVPRSVELASPRTLRNLASGREEIEQLQIRNDALHHALRQSAGALTQKSATAERQGEEAADMESAEEIALELAQVQTEHNSCTERCKHEVRALRVEIETVESRAAEERRSLRLLLSEICVDREVLETELEAARDVRHQHLCSLQREEHRLVGEVHEMRQAGISLKGPEAYAIHTHRTPEGTPTELSALPEVPLLYELGGVHHADLERDAALHPLGTLRLALQDTLDSPAYVQDGHDPDSCSSSESSPTSSSGFPWE